MFKNNRSIKQQILFSSLGLLLLAFIINAVLTGYFINNKSQEVLIEKAREQVYEMSKQAEDILDRKMTQLMHYKNLLTKKLDKIMWHMLL